MTATEADGRVDVGARHRDDSREERERRERREECPPQHRDRSLEAREDVRATLRLRQGKSMIRKLLLTALDLKSRCRLFQMVLQDGSTTVDQSFADRERWGKRSICLSGKSP